MDEPQNLLFANHCITELVDSALEIYHYLIRLNCFATNTYDPSGGDETNRAFGFEKLFEELNWMQDKSLYIESWSSSLQGLHMVTWAHLF